MKVIQLILGLLLLFNGCSGAQSSSLIENSPECQEDNQSHVFECNSSSSNNNPIYVCVDSCSVLKQYSWCAQVTSAGSRNAVAGCGSDTKCEVSISNNSTQTMHCEEYDQSLNQGSK